MFAMAHDYRVMGTGKGFMCLPELDINMPIPEGMTKVCQVKLSPEVYTEMMYGKRFTAEEAESLKMINKCVKKELVFEYCQLLAKEHIKRGTNKDKLKIIKYCAYKEAYEACLRGETDHTIPVVQRAKL
jgi:enoyl-CoA hydratase/carnithine racemase